jgi:hypothetical protein
MKGVQAMKAISEDIGIRLSMGRSIVEAQRRPHVEGANSGPGVTVYSLLFVSDATSND